VTRCAQQAQRTLQVLVCFRSVHAAVLQPHRLARWLEAAVKLLPEEQCALLAQTTAVVLSPRHPAAGQNYAGEAPANVTAEEWREGSVQLQQEVGDSTRCWPSGPCCLHHIIHCCAQLTASCRPRLLEWRFRCYKLPPLRLGCVWGQSISHYSTLFSSMPITRRTCLA
jgi:hypothetical protein